MQSWNPWKNIQWPLLFSTHTHTHTKQWSRAKTVDLQMTFRASGHLAECLPHSNSIRSVRYVLDNWYVQDNKQGFCIRKIFLKVRCVSILLFSNTSAPLNLLTSAGAVPSAESVLCVSFILCHSMSSQGVLWVWAPLHMAGCSLLSPWRSLASHCFGAVTYLLNFPLGLELFGRPRTVSFIHPYNVSFTACGVYLTRFLINKGKRDTVDRKSGVQVTKHQPERASDLARIPKERAFLLLSWTPNAFPYTHSSIRCISGEVEGKGLQKWETGLKNLSPKGWGLCPLGPHCCSFEPVLFPCLLAGSIWHFATWWKVRTLPLHK